MPTCFMVCGIHITLSGENNFQIGSGEIFGSSLQKRNYFAEVSCCCLRIYYACMYACFDTATLVFVFCSVCNFISVCTSKTLISTLTNQGASIYFTWPKVCRQLNITHLFEYLILKSWGF